MVASGGFGFGVWDLHRNLLLLDIPSLLYRGSRISGFRFRSRVSGLGFRISGFEIRVSDFGSRISPGNPRQVPSPPA